MKAYSFWSQLRNEVIVIIAYNIESAGNTLHKHYTDADDFDWIIGSSIDLNELSHMSITIPIL